MTFPLVCCNLDNIDAVKKILTYRIQELTGRRPRLECFQLHQNGTPLPFTEPITSLTTWIQCILSGLLQTTEILITQTLRIGGDLTYGDQQ